MLAIVPTQSVVILTNKIKIINQAFTFHFNSLNNKASKEWLLGRM